MAERAERDAQAEEHRRLIQRANAYVQSYRKRGAITPPDACEHCYRNDNGNGNDYTKKRTTLPAWHPDPAHPRDILWLCKNCRAIARALGEPVELRWQWPGGSRTAPCFVTPTPVWERRLRQDRLPHHPPQTSTIPPMTDAEYEQKITSALSKLDKAIVAADALLSGMIIQTVPCVVVTAFP